MKYLILLLISFNLFADVKVTVTDSLGRISCGDGCKFKTQQEADAWITGNISNDSWGKKAEYIIKQVDDDLSSCLSTEPDDFGIKCKIKDAEYSIVIEDITAEVQAKEAEDAAKKLRIDELKAKDKDTMKLDELVELLKLQGII